MSKTLPTFSLEKRLWKKGYKYVIGVDEVGRGALAGPLVAGAVFFPAPRQFKIENLKFKIVKRLGIDDSKRLSPKKRLKLAAEIKDCCQNYAIASESVETINRVGIVKATEKAMRKAIGSVIEQWNMNNEQQKNGKKAKLSTIHSSLFFVLVDGFHIKYIPGIGLKNQKNIFDGDRKCISIAAASILAKVYRDNLMEKLAKKPKYKKYGWERNKGYGTKSHILAIKKYGLTKFHRKLFVKNF